MRMHFKGRQRSEIRTFWLFQKKISYFYPTLQHGGRSVILFLTKIPTDFFFFFYLFSEPKNFHCQTLSKNLEIYEKCESLFSFVDQLEFIFYQLKITRVKSNDHLFWFFFLFLSHVVVFPRFFFSKPRHDRRAIKFYVIWRCLRGWRSV